MTAGETTWVEIGGVPLEAHVYAWHNDPEHPLTPTNVRQQAGGIKSHLGTAVWRQIPYVGIILGITERTWNQSDLLSVELSFMKPGKGTGHVAVTVADSEQRWADQLIVSTKRYDEKTLSWCRKLLAAVASIGVETKEEDQGFDA